jgi:hypothetical protein
MQVLPVGISVFGGITTITILFVVLVTLERVRYRKVGFPPCTLCATIYRLFVLQVFRARRLAEQGAAMGSGGNSRDDKV